MPRAPSVRPQQYQTWRNLLFLHWPVRAEALRPLVPRALDIDTHQGTAYVGLIAFEIPSLRFQGTPRFLRMAFLETNLRTYVCRGGREAGIFFFSLDAASRPAVWGARACFSLPYYLARMGSWGIDGGETAYQLERLSGARPTLSLRYRAGEPLGPSLPGSLDHFLIERYLLHVERRGKIRSVRVQHPPYPLRRAEVLHLEEGLTRAAGIERPPGLPPIVHYSSGVEVEVFSSPRP